MKYVKSFESFSYSINEEEGLFSRLGEWWDSLKNSLKNLWNKLTGSYREGMEKAKEVMEKYADKFNAACKLVSEKVGIEDIKDCYEKLKNYVPPTDEKKLQPVLKENYTLITEEILGMSAVEFLKMIGWLSSAAITIGGAIVTLLALLGTGLGIGVLAGAIITFAAAICWKCLSAVAGSGKNLNPSRLKLSPF